MAEFRYDNGEGEKRIIVNGAPNMIDLFAFRDELMTAGIAAMKDPKEALELMSAKRLGLACVIDDDGKLIGLFTDGDLRRLLLKSQKPISALFADDIITHARTEFTSVDRNMDIEEALKLLQDQEIFDLPVLDENGRLEGVIHLHPALKELLVK